MDRALRNPWLKQSPKALTIKRQSCMRVPTRPEVAFHLSSTGFDIDSMPFIRAIPPTSVATIASGLATRAQSTSLGTGIDVWNFFTEGGGQIDLMVLLLHEDLANLFSHRVFSKRFTLRDAIAVIANGFVFIVEIVAEHVFGVLRCADQL